jgi:hypothetical protein
MDDPRMSSWTFGAWLQGVMDEMTKQEHCKHGTLPEWCDKGCILSARQWLAKNGMPQHGEWQERMEQYALYRIESED